MNPPEMKVVLSELARTPKQRALVRARTRYRRGYARTTRGQERAIHKQHGHNLRD